MLEIRLKMARCSCSWQLAAVPTQFRDSPLGGLCTAPLVLALAVEFPKIAFPTGTRTYGLERGQGEWILD
jgi:hypothetical protein